MHNSKHLKYSRKHIGQSCCDRSRSVSQVSMSREEIAEFSQRRKERILTYITQDPPVPMVNIMAMEGITEKLLRDTIYDLQKDHGIKYTGTAASRAGITAVYGLSDDTLRLRAKLADNLYAATDPDTGQLGLKGRLEACPILGMNHREQIRAESKPFNHDWTLSQIERLARALGKNPRDLLLECLTT